MTRRRTAILISGRGSNMKALIEANAAPGASAEIALVLANQADAGGLETARAAGIPTRVVDHRDHPERDAFDRALNAAIRPFEIDLLCLAGFMRILSPWLVEFWQNRMLNIHPSLLPAFKGLNTHERALASGVRVHGCSIHLVRPELDNGPIILQGLAPVLPGDDADALTARVLELEHRCYPLALELIASGRARVEGSHVTILDDTPAVVLHETLKGR
jgi:phosphoribosylglycinamide formyltransferase-1